MHLFSLIKKLRVKMLHIQPDQPIFSKRFLVHATFMGLAEAQGRTIFPSRLHVENPAVVVPLPQINILTRLQCNSVDTQIVRFSYVRPLRLPHLLQLLFLPLFLRTRPLLDVKLHLLPNPPKAKDAHAARLAEIPSVLLGEAAIVSQLFDVGRRSENVVFSRVDETQVEIPHLLAGCAVAFVDADRFGGGGEDGRELELDLVLHGAAVAGPGVCFKVGHIGSCSVPWTGGVSRADRLYVVQAV
jgi:hypothetical protein